MKHRTTFNFITLGIFISFLLFPLMISSVHADSTDLKSKLEKSLTDLGGGVGTEKNVGVIIGRIVQAAFGVLGLVFLIMVIYAGFIWTTAGGDSKKTKEARNMIINGAIGLAITISGYSITHFIVKAIQRASGLSP